MNSFLMGPSDYSGLHPADALSLVSDARRLGLHAYIFASSGSATALVGVVATRGILSGILPGIRVGIVSIQPLFWRFEQ